MSVYARDDSRYWWFHCEGTDIRQSTRIPIGHGAARARSREDADAIYRAAMGDLARGAFKLPTRKAARTFRQHATWYVEHVTVTHRTKARERSAITNLVAHFGDATLSSITASAIDAWRLNRAKQVKQSTVNRELEILKPLLGSAVPQYLETNPAAGVKKFRLRYPPIAILSPEAERAILAVASPVERAFFLLGLDALLRLSDVRRLRVEHDRGLWLEIVDPKVEAYKVPVSRRLRAALDALEPKGGYYFPRRYGVRGKGEQPRNADAWHAVSPATAHAIFADLCARAGVPTGRVRGGVTFHSLRHTGATRAARSVKLTVVQRLGGWKNLTQLARYDHPDDPEIMRAVEAIAYEHEGPALVKERGLTVVADDGVSVSEDAVDAASHEDAPSAKTIITRERNQSTTRVNSRREPDVNDSTAEQARNAPQRGTARHGRTATTAHTRAG